jgi:hypothetical protein
LDYLRERVVEADVPLRGKRFRIPRALLPRVAAWSVALLSLPGISYYVSGTEELPFVLPLSLGFLFFLLLFYSMPGQTQLPEAAKVTNFYSCAYLWFIFIFWTLLIGTIAWLLWRQFPR